MQDYASRLGASLTGLAPPAGMPKPMAGYQLSADGAMVTPEQRSILDAMLGIFNNPGMLADPKMKGPK
jgi:hypothetical protein